jgi:hypothetical protein
MTLDSGRPDSDATIVNPKFPTRCSIIAWCNVIISLQLWKHSLSITTDADDDSIAPERDWKNSLGTLTSE